MDATENFRPRSRALIAATLIALAIASISFAPSSARAADAPVDCLNETATPDQISMSSYEGATLCLLNDIRREHGLPGFTVNPLLDASAAAHSSDMWSQQFFAHDSSDGSYFAARILGTGYARGARRWLIGENIAWGTSGLGTPAALMTAWMHSPEHRRNILTSRFREVGISAVRGTPSDASDPYGVIITNDFGRTWGGSQLTDRSRRGA